MFAASPLPRNHPTKRHDVVVDTDLMVFRGVEDLDASHIYEDDAVRAHSSAPQHEYYPPSVTCDVSIISSGIAPPTLAQEADLMQFYPEHIEYQNNHHSSPCSVSTVTVGGDRPPNRVRVPTAHEDAASWRQEPPTSTTALLLGCHRRIFVCLGMVVVFTIAAGAFVATVLLTADTNSVVPSKQGISNSQVNSTAQQPPTPVLVRTTPSPTVVSLDATNAPTVPSIVSEAVATSHPTPLAAKPTVAVPTTLAPAFVAKQGLSGGPRPATNTSTASNAPVTKPTSPTVAPVSVSSPVVSILSATHVIQWGTYSTCNTTQAPVEAFGVYDLTVTCRNGTIRLQDSVNAVCEERVLSTAPPAVLGCRITTNATLTPTASVIVTCVGDTPAGVEAMAEMPARTAGVCAAASRNRALVRRRQLFASASPTNEGAASFVQMGRFCGSNTELWHQVYPCQVGERLVTTLNGTAWNGTVPSLQGIQTQNGTRGNFFVSLSGPPWQTSKLQNYCFQARWPCGSKSTSGLSNFTCSNRVAVVQMANTDHRDTCVTRHATTSEATRLTSTTLAYMKTTVGETMVLSAFGTWMTRQLEVQ